MPDDELISAYLDDELSGEELARAERLLATQPESRQLLEELRALRSSMQALPRHQLGPGFAEGVLRRAEREILLPREAAPERAGRSQNFDADAAPTVLSWQRWKRPLAWSALAAAAALVIMIFAPDQQQVALAPAPHAAERGQKAAGEALARGGRAEHAGAHRELTIAAPQEPSAGVEADALSAELNRATAADRLLVIQCDVPDGIDTVTSLRTLLAKNGIAWQEDSSDGSAPQMAAQPASKQSPEAQAESKRLATDGRQSPSDLASQGVYVVARPEEMQAALASLVASREFRNLSAQGAAPQADSSTKELDKSPPPAPLAVAESAQDVKLYSNSQNQAKDKANAPQPVAPAGQSEEDNTPGQPQSRRKMQAEGMPAAIADSATRQAGQENRGRAMIVPLTDALQRDTSQGLPPRTPATANTPAGAAGAPADVAAKSISPAAAPAERPAPQAAPASESLPMHDGDKQNVAGEAPRWSRVLFVFRVAAPAAPQP